MMNCFGCKYRGRSYICDRCIGWNKYELNGLSAAKQTDIKKEVHMLLEPIKVGGFTLDLDPKGETNMKIKNVIFNYPATIVFWEDGTKTVVKSGDHDIFDPEKGLAMAIAKKALGNTGKYYEVFKKWIREDNTPPKIEDINGRSKAKELIATDIKVEEKDDGIEVTGYLTEKGKELVERISCKDCVYYAQIGGYCKRNPDRCFTCFPSNTCKYAVKRESDVSGE